MQFQVSKNVRQSTGVLDFTLAGTVEAESLDEAKAKAARQWPQYPNASVSPARERQLCVAYRYDLAMRA